MDDPLYVEEEEDDYWYRGYNMRTGERGIFPAFYAHEVIGQSKELLGKCKNTAAYFFLLFYSKHTERSHFLCILHSVGMKRNPAWIETFSVQFLGSVEVPYHQGNGILCAAMQKVRKAHLHFYYYGLCTMGRIQMWFLSVLDCNIEKTDGTCATSLSM